MRQHTPRNRGPGLWTGLLGKPSLDKLPLGKSLSGIALSFVFLFAFALAASADDTTLELASGEFSVVSVAPAPGGQMAVIHPSAPAAGPLIYDDFKQVEARARFLLKRNLGFREDISPYKDRANFDQLVRKFDAAVGFGVAYDDPDPAIPSMTLQQRIDLADAELREARDLYAFLAVFAPETRFREDGFYTESPPEGDTVPLCGDLDRGSKEDPNPPDPQFTGQVLDPVLDWCNFPARLRQSVRESAQIRMIFAQQFMVDALGLHFSGGEFYGGEKFVRDEVAKLRAAKHQYDLAEMGVAEAMTRAVGNGCMVSDFFEQPEWSLLSRTAENQTTAQHHIAIRQSYLNINQPGDVAQAKAEAESTFRTASMEGYIKMARMAGVVTNPVSGFECARGVAPTAQLASDLALRVQETRHKAREMSDGRNIFGFDVNFTPARPYYLHPDNQDRGLWNEAMAAVDTARDMEKDEVQNSRVFDQTQKDLRDAITDLKETLDVEISNDLSCSRASSEANDPEFFACARQQIQELNSCLDYVQVDPKTKGIDEFDACMDRKDGAGQLVIHEGGRARQALFELRSAALEQQSIEDRARNIDKRIQLSDGRNAIVTRWLASAGAAETAARTSQAAFDMISNMSSNPFEAVDNAAISAEGAINIAAQLTAGTLSTAADVEIENAEQYEEVQNLLLDQSELVIDALVAEQAARAKYVEFEVIIGHMEDVVVEAQRQRAYLKLSPGNDPGYRIIRDSKRLELAKQLEYAARLAYLTARRGEYEYAARLSASNFRISDIYRARTAGDIRRFLEQLKSTTDNLAAGTSSAAIDPSDFTVSVAQQVLGLTDDALAREGFIEPEAAEAERVRRFRLWVAQNTVANDFEAPFDGKPVLRYSFTTSLLNGGLFSDVIQQGYDRYWLLKLAGIGEPKPSNTGMSVDVQTSQAGLSYRTLSVTQSGVAHLRAQSGCVFDYRLMPPAVLLGLEWPITQPPEQTTAVFKGNINGGHDWTENGFRTSAFLGRPVSATDWQVLVFASAPESGMIDMDLQQLTDIELNFSTTHASRTPGQPQLTECTRIDY